MWHRSPPDPVARFHFLEVAQYFAPGITAHDRVRALAADSISRRRDRVAVGANRRTVRRLIEAPVPPRHRQEVTGLMLDAFDAVLRQLVEIKAPRAMELRGYAGRSTRSAGGWPSCIRARSGRRRRPAISRAG
jgi:hypothetical protein